MLREGGISSKKSYWNVFITANFMEHTVNMIVQIIVFCDPNDQEKRENFWIHKLRTLYPDGLNHKKINQLTFNIFVQLPMNFI